jgi:hypothetical protein
MNRVLLAASMREGFSARSKTPIPSPARTFRQVREYVNSLPRPAVE